MDSAQRATVLKYVFYHRSKFPEFRDITNDANSRSQTPRQFECTGQQRSAIELHKSLVDAHPSAFAACEDESGHIRHGAIIHSPPSALKRAGPTPLGDPEYSRGCIPPERHPQANPMYSNALSPRQRSPVHEGNLFKAGGSGEDEPTFGVRPVRKYPHAAETHGRSYAWAVFSRVFLAEAWRRRRILPGLLAVRGRIQVRLGDHAPHRARRTRQT